MRLESGAISDLHEFAAFLHRPIPRQLRLRHRPRLLRRMPALELAARRDIPRDLRGDAQPDAAAPHLRERHRALTAVGLIGESRFAATNFFDGASEIAIPFDRVHRQVEVCIHYQHWFINFNGSHGSSTATCQNPQEKREKRELIF